MLCIISGETMRFDQSSTDFRPLGVRIRPRKPVDSLTVMATGWMLARWKLSLPSAFVHLDGPELLRCSGGSWP